jgi:hypothetical protein
MEWLRGFVQGRVQLHLIEEGGGGHGPHEDDVLFPDKGQANDITCVGLTNNLMMLGTKRGTLQVRAGPGLYAGRGSIRRMQVTSDHLRMVQV